MDIEKETKWLVKNSEHIKKIEVKRGNLIVVVFNILTYYSTKDNIINLNNKKDYKFEIELDNTSLVINAFYIQDNLDYSLANPFLPLCFPYGKSINKNRFYWYKKSSYKKPLIDFIIELLNTLVMNIKFYQKSDVIDIHYGNPILYSMFENHRKLYSIYNIFPLEKNVLLENRYRFNKDKTIPDKEKPSGSKKFKIESSTEKYTPKEVDFDEYIKRENIIEKNEHNEDSNHELYIAEDAWKEITKHIGWGKNNVEFNKVEQGGLLLGEVYKDISNGKLFGIVKHIISAKSARGSATYLDMNHNVWKKMLDDKDDIQDKNIHIIGWYHTHPNNLNVYMSGTDKNTQVAMFPEYWHFAVVLNPHKLLWKGFLGTECNQIKTYRIKNENI